MIRHNKMFQIIIELKHFVIAISCFDISSTFTSNSCDIICKNKLFFLVEFAEHINDIIVKTFFKYRKVAPYTVLDMYTEWVYRLNIINQMAKCKVKNGLMGCSTNQMQSIAEELLTLCVCLSKKNVW